MLLILTKALGRFIAFCPESLLSLFAQTLGNLLYLVYGSRRRMMLHSIACSFPERPEAWRRKVARTSCVRLIETGLMSLAAPFFSEKRILAMASMSARAVDKMAFFAEGPTPAVLGTVHLSYWEGLTWVPLLMRPKLPPEIVTIFRPLRNPKLDAWLRSTRERFGIRLMSRKSGLHAALHTLQRKGSVAILFDQSAGSHGYLTKFLGRECSTTPLPGLLVEKSGARLCIIYPRRHAFWRFEIDMVELEHDKTPEGVTLALNRGFEDMLKNDEVLCSSWLWLHKRWRILDRPEEKRKLEAKRGGLIE